MDDDERGQVISGLVEELRLVKEELKRMRAEGAAPTEEGVDPVAAEIARRQAEAAFDREVKKAMDPRELRLKALAQIYGPPTERK